MLLREPGPTTHPGAGPRRAGGGRAETWSGQREGDQGAVCTPASLVRTLPGSQPEAPQADSTLIGERGSAPSVPAAPHLAPPCADKDGRPAVKASRRGAPGLGGLPPAWLLQAKGQAPTIMPTAAQPCRVEAPLETAPSDTGLGRWGLCPHTCWEFNSAWPRLPVGNQLVQTPHPAPEFPAWEGGSPNNPDVGLLHNSACGFLCACSLTNDDQTIRQQVS